MNAQQRQGALQLKPLYQRAWVAASGPLANFLLAIVLLTGLSLYAGHTMVTPLIGQVTQGSPAALAGIKTGDLVKKVDDTVITDFQQLPQIISISGGSPLAIGIRRAG